MDYVAMTDDELTAEIGRRINWRSRPPVLECTLPDYAADLNEAAHLFTLTGRECDLCFTLIQLDMHYDTWAWQAMIGLDHEGDEIPYEGIDDNPARAVCIAWLCWHDEQEAHDAPN